MMFDCLRVDLHLFGATGGLALPNCACIDAVKWDVPAATAILDRLLENAEVIQIPGKRYRLRGKKDNPQANT